MKTIPNLIHPDSSSSLAFIQAEVTRFTHFFQKMWWECSADFPEFPVRYTTTDHNRNVRVMRDTIKGIEAALKKQALAGSMEKEQNRKEMLDLASGFARATLGFEDRHVDLILDNDFVEVVQAFAQQARELVPGICDEDIYQASRNVLTMNFMQLLMGQKVRLTPSIFAYSLLYPLTDNYLDDPEILQDEKQAFGVRFHQRLMGENIKPGNSQENSIWECIKLIENEYPRKSNSLVHASLLAIHDSQLRSLDLLHHNSPPYEVDVLGLTFEKGGAAVVADGYLVAGDLTEKEREFMFAYGAFTQLMDDLEDTLIDRREGVLTLFSQVAGNWPLDSITNRLFHFGNQAFQSVNYFKGTKVQTLKEMIWKCIDSLLIDFASQNPAFYSKGYLGKLEEHFPFSYKGLQNSRKQLERKRFNAMDLVKAFAKTST